MITRLPVVRIVIVLAAAFTLWAMWSNVSSYASPGAADQLRSWTPQGTLSGTWLAGTPVYGHPIPSNPDCRLNARPWQRGNEVRIVLEWTECLAKPDDTTRMYIQIPPSVPNSWRQYHSALPGGADVVKPLNDTTHARFWVEDHYLIGISANCPSMTRTECLNLTARAAQDLSSRLPGDPLAISAPYQLHVVWSRFLCFWLLFVGIGGLARLIGRETFAVSEGNPR
jgi:hypothetical protein